MMKQQARTAALMAAIIFITLAATRLPLAPKYLYHFDSVNFALSINEFNPAKHQPQPPGYPMFVALLRLIHLAIQPAEYVLLAAGLVMATAAAVCLWHLTNQMFGRNAAVIAVTLFVFNPACWFGGVTNQVRLCLAFCSTGIALLAWHALRRPGNPWLLYAAFAALGIGAGFRPALGVLLIPLLLWVWWNTGRSFSRLLTCAALTALATAPWITASAMAVGGLKQWLTLMWGYSNEQFHGTSAVFGASTQSAWQMAWQATVWNGLGALTWIWAIPFSRTKWPKAAPAFLLVWFIPIFLFSALIHIGDPDQALASIPILCGVGGAVLAAFLQRHSSRSVAVAAVAVAILNTALFFNPPRGPARASGYRAVASMDIRTQSLFRAINELKTTSSPVSIVHYRGVVSWRQISYYFQNDYLMFLAPGLDEYSWTLFHLASLDQKQPPHSLPGPKRVILIAPLENQLEMESAGWKKHGPVYYRDIEPNQQIDIGPYHLSQPDTVT
jgi:hypothetical protein